MTKILQIGEIANCNNAQVSMNKAYQPSSLSFETDSKRIPSAGFFSNFSSNLFLESISKLIISKLHTVEWRPLLVHSTFSSSYIYLKKASRFPHLFASVLRIRPGPIRGAPLTITVIKPSGLWRWWLNDGMW